MEERFSVYVDCPTYNQASYIKTTMDGFCVQETTFPFVCGIIDDASSDGEQEVIRLYLEDNFNLSDNTIVRNDETADFVRVFAQHKTNKNCYFLVVFLKYNHYSINKSRFLHVAEWKNNARYVAVCEGDDFWIDSLKLQKQVDFMESHPENSLCFCGHKNVYSDGQVKDVFRYDRNMTYCPMEDAIRFGGSFMATVTMLYRKDKGDNRPQWSVGLPIGDLPTMLVLMGRGKCGFLCDIMAAYRVNAAGSWSLKMKKDKQKKLLLLSSVRRMYKSFDSWTGRVYHSAIVKRCLEIDFYILRQRLGLL